MSSSEIGKQVRLVEESRGRDNEAILTLLKLIRVAQVRLPRTVTRWGSCLRGTKPPEVVEQLLIAALDVHDIPLAETYEKVLREQFKTGSRLDRLSATVLEAKKKWSEAAAVYEKLLDENGANSVAHKRLICVTRGEKALDGPTFAALDAYQKEFQSDRNAWQFQAELHTKHHETFKAIFCYEEMTLFEPAAPHWHWRLGELYCGHNDLNARKHFAHSLDLSKVKGTVVGNARAATGLLLVCHNIGQKDPDDPLNVALGAFAASHLKATYTKNNANTDLVANVVAPFVAKKSPPYTKN